MRGFLIVLAWLIAWLPIEASAEPTVPLRHGGSPVSFAVWAPETAEFDYRELALSQQRLEELRAKSYPTVDPLFRAELHVRADGTLEEKTVQSRLYLGTSGVHDQGNIQVWVDSAGQTLIIRQAYTLLPDGRRFDVDPSTVQLVADSSDDIFTDSFKVIVPFPRLERDAIAVLVTLVRETANTRILPWSRLYFSQTTVPAEEFDVVLSWDKRAPEPAWKTDDDRLRCARPESRRVRCRSSNIPPYPDDPDVRYIDVLPSLVIAEPTTWKGLARKMQWVVGSAIVTGPDIAPLAGELAQSPGSEQTRLDRIHQFVSQNIRYIGLEHGVGGIVPRPPAVTLERRFGDCKDKTALFLALARRAGLKAYPVLTSTERFNPGKLLVAAGVYFNHMVACIVMNDGREHCIDLTDPYSPYDKMPITLQGAVRLDLADIPSEPGIFAALPYASMKEVKVVNRFGADGSIEEHRTMAYTDHNAGRIRATLRPKSEAERARWGLDYYHDYVNRNVGPAFEFDGIDDVHAPVRMRSKVSYPGVFDPASFKEYSEIEAELGAWLAEAKSRNTANQYAFRGLSYRGEIVFELPGNYRAAYLGPVLDLRTPFGELRRRYEKSGATVKVVTDLTMPRAVLSVDRIGRFNSFIDRIGENAKIWFAIEPANAP
jgi:transglutaminase-like putative cysteine protease